MKGGMKRLRFGNIENIKKKTTKELLVTSEDEYKNVSYNVITKWRIVIRFFVNLFTFSNHTFFLYLSPTTYIEFKPMLYDVTVI